MVPWAEVDILVVDPRGMGGKNNTKYIHTPLPIFGRLGPEIRPKTRIGLKRPEMKYSHLYIFRLGARN